MAEADIKRVSKGYLQRNQAFATVIEAPGFYEGDTEEYSRRVVETELRKIGFLTHIVVVWHALELRESDLDVVLSEELVGSLLYPLDPNNVVTQGVEVD